MMSVGRRLRDASATDENIRTPRGRGRPDDSPWARLLLTIPHSIRNLDDVDLLPDAPRTGCSSSQGVGTLA
jgi:hypothetical protein